MSMKSAAGYLHEARLALTIVTDIFQQHVEETTISADTPVHIDAMLRPDERAAIRAAADALGKAHQAIGRALARLEE